MKSIQDIVVKVQDAFRESRPNGILLGWDENRFFSSLCAICADCKVTNDTDFNYSNCNSFNIELKATSLEHDYVITLKTSFILDAYSLHVTKYSKDRRRGEVVWEEKRPELKPVIETIRQFAEKKGFQEIGGAESNTVIDGVALELAEEATLGKCLFDDFE